MITHKIILLSSILLIIVFYSGCEDGNTFVGYEGDRKLAEGEPVPFLLQQNYPNPFNPTTVISFRVAVTLNLKLTVFSDEWQPVRVLIERSINAGVYQVTFDAADLPSGDYYYILEGGGYRQIRIMKLVK